MAKKVISVIFLSLLLLLSFSFQAQARSAIYDILAKGSKWQLNVDGEQGTLELLGGRGSRTADGGWQMSMEIRWQGNAGTLRATADGGNSEQRVILQVQRRNGLRVTCEGYVAQETDQFMAGETLHPAVPSAIHGAWYATAIKTGKIRPETLDSGRIAHEIKPSISPEIARAVSAANLSSISGKVFGPRVDAARVFFVILYGPDDLTKYRETSKFDENGCYSFTNLPRGKYKLVLDTKADIAVGPHPRFHIVDCVGAAVPEVNFELK